MTTLKLPGRITETGDLEVQLPVGLPPGEVTVRIDVPDVTPDWDQQPWTEQELTDLMQPDPKTGAEIAAMLANMPPLDFADSQIGDPVIWLQAQRRKEENRLKSAWDSQP